jgi:hypothetical protein
VGRLNALQAAEEHLPEVGVSTEPLERAVRGGLAVLGQVSTGEACPPPRYRTEIRGYAALGPAAIIRTGTAPPAALVSDLHACHVWEGHSKKVEAWRSNIGEVRRQAQTDGHDGLARSIVVGHVSSSDPSTGAAPPSRSRPRPAGSCEQLPTVARTLSAEVNRLALGTAPVGRRHEWGRWGTAPGCTG